MKLCGLSVRNFRGLAELEIQLGGESAFLIGENGSGKSSLLAAISRVLGAERQFGKQDFNDLDRAVEITAMLTEFSDEERGELSEALTFGEPTYLRLLARATWDPDLETVESEHLLPDKSERRTKPDERAAIPVVRLPASRDVSKLLAFGSRRNVLGTILEGLDLEDDIGETTDLVAQANERLGSAEALTEILKAAAGNLEQLRPLAGDAPLSIGSGASTVLQLLAHLELRVSDHDASLSLQHQSSGVGQMTLFSFLICLLRRNPRTMLLLDEPEISLHPQAQRALMRLLSLQDAQVVLSTHSSNLLERADPRRIIRLRRANDAVTVHSPVAVSDADARRLARFTNAQTAESFFARSVILVEGVSDKLAVEALAERKGKNLDSLGVTIVSLDGANSLGVYLQLLGQDGLSLDLLGLCDSEKQELWRRQLEASGYDAPDCDAMEALGFFTADRDLEDELVRAVGSDRVENEIQAQGDGAAWDRFRQQPNQAGVAREEQLRRFLRTKDRKVRYSPVLVDACEEGAFPRILEELVDRVG